MRSLPRLSTVLFSVLAAAVLGAATADDSVTLKTVKYDELGRAVRDLQGKIVVVDFWGEF
jgi:hypothetical protein